MQLAWHSEPKSYAEKELAFNVGVFAKQKPDRPSVACLNPKHRLQ